MASLHSQFPIGLNVNWVSTVDTPDVPSLQDWLLDASSLTARLQRQCQNFRVELLGQRVEPCQAHEANAKIQQGEQVLVREVVLFCDHQPTVFARSLLPLASLTGPQQQLAELGERPLGQVLFNDPNLRRDIVEIAEIAPSLRVCELAALLDLQVTHSLWGRRSLFYIGDKPLMVAEVFLPGSAAYENLMKS
ncbi:chorismate lyase [Thalassotalea ponticola]|uniref:chorismate--pyruvate lyase family protein n=1 Tax=Thalassotalea ponticola TaxID=1523392 RepID=UPI0025B2D110|nr:chorismate lyase [Thalassotalea ponticola]MDN3652790.1 chorismate lyase [Thalassotalea ponticola]